MRNKNRVHRDWHCMFVHLVVVILAIGLTGCGQAGQPSDGAEAERALPSAFFAPEAAPIVEPTGPVVFENAPVLSDVYPTLSSGVLSQARLTELPPDVILQAEGVSITKRDLERDLDQIPLPMREQARKNAFFMLEQKATYDLLLALAGRKFGDDGLDDDSLLQRYFGEMTQTAAVSDAEVDVFYKENPEMMGGASLEQIKPSIREHLRQEKQQQIVENHIRGLGRETTIVLSAEWVREQAALVIDNAVDRARASGKPTFVNFGAKGCVPCDMMEPVREELKKEYEGRVNVVFVHVNQEQMLASRYGVRGIPHLVFFDQDGKQVHAHTGFMAREQIEEWLRKSGVKGI